MLYRMPFARRPAEKIRFFPLAFGSLIVITRVFRLLATPTSSGFSQRSSRLCLDSRYALVSNPVLKEILLMSRLASSKTAKN